MPASSNEVDYQLKMARNHIVAFLKVTDPGFEDLYDSVKPFTMCPVERLYDLHKAARYVDEAGVPGDIVEVGVWRGGALAMAAMSSTKERMCVGFDTFSGHLEPGKEELDVWGNNLSERWTEETQEGALTWASASASEARATFDAVGVDQARVRLVEGDIKETVHSWPGRAISILRIDCDWYPESIATLAGLYPYLSQGGVLICDDYGHHSGQRQAVDEFFADQAIRFTHIDYSCIVSIKMDAPERD